MELRRDGGSVTTTHIMSVKRTMSKAKIQIRRLDRASRFYKCSLSSSHRCLDVTKIYDKLWRKYVFRDATLNGKSPELTQTTTQQNLYSSSHTCTSRKVQQVVPNLLKLKYYQNCSSHCADWPTTQFCSTKCTRKCCRVQDSSSTSMFNSLTHVLHAMNLESIIPKVLIVLVLRWLSLYRSHLIFFGRINDNAQRCFVFLHKTK